MRKFAFIVLALWIWIPMGYPDARAGVPHPARFSLFDVERRIESDGSRGPFRMSDRAILAGSERVWASGRLQERDLDYQVDDRTARLTFFQALPRGTPIVIRFQQLPRVLRRVYRHRPLPGAGEKTLSIQRRMHPLRPGEPRGPASPKDDSPRLEIGGSKRIQVAFGSDRDAALAQSLQVRISGEVAEGVSLLALLSDRNFPLYSGGGTRSLQELDRVFFQVRSRSFTAGLGDQEVVFGGTTFGRYRRRLQGAKLAVSLPGGDATFFGAVSEGRWTTRRLALAGGYQGPYRLGGSEGAAGARVLAGSERVYLDGRLLRRGEGQDYVIDYDRGLLTFTPAHPISSASRVTVAYQYADGNGRRRVMGFRGRLAPGDERIRLGTTLLRETDEPRVLPPGAGLPVSNRGARQVTALDAAYIPVEGLTFSGEVALSHLSAHAPEGEGRHRGSAFRVGVDLTPHTVRLGRREIGRLRFTGTYRQVGAQFAGFERIDRVASEGRWGWAAGAEGEGERLGEVALHYAPVEDIRLDVGYGRRSGRRLAARREVGVEVSGRRATKAYYRYEEVRQQNGSLSRQHAEVAAAVWKVRPGFRFSSETARGEAVGESSLFYASSLPGTAIPEGVLVRETAGEISAGDGKRLGWTSTLSLRRTRLLAGEWQDSLRAWSHRHRVQLAGWHGLSLFGEYSSASVRTPRQPGEGRHTRLSMVQMGYTSPDGILSQQITYRISHTGAPNRAPAFVYVGRGQGDFLWEDADGDGAQDREEFAPDADGDYALFYGADQGFRPVREAVLGTRSEVTFRRLMPSPDRIWQRVLAGIALDVSVEADRQALPGYGGVAPWQLYGFRADAGVLRGHRDIRTRVHLFRYHRGASFRVSARKQSRLDRTYSDGEVEGVSEIAFQGRFQIGARYDLEAAFTRAARRRGGEGAFAYGIRSRELTARSMWRFGNGWQLGVRTKWGREREDRRGLRLSRVSLNPEVVRSLPGRGRIRCDVDWTVVSATDRPPLFLGMADGNRVGYNLLWHVGMDYRMARSITALLTYDGRRRPGQPVRQVGRMEMQANF